MTELPCPFCGSIVLVVDGTTEARCGHCRRRLTVWVEPVEHAVHCRMVHNLRYWAATED